MKKKLALLAAPAMMLAATTAIANEWCVAPYAGIDAQYRYMDAQRNFGGNLFRNNFPQGNVYVGLKFNEFFGAEVGYEATTRKNRTVTLGPGASANGPVLDSTTTVTYNTTAKIQGPHADLVGFYPICPEYCLELIGSVGVASLTAKYQRTAVILDGTPINPVLRTFSNRRAILRASAGLQHMLCDNVGVRGTIGWENTKKFTISSKEVAGLSTNLKNSWIGSLGLFATF